MKTVDNMSTSTVTSQGVTGESLSVGQGSGKINAAIWQTTETRALELLALEKVLPHFGTMRESKWGVMTKQAFSEHPGVKDSDKLRLVFNRAMEVGKRDIGIKAALSLARIGKYGEHASELSEFFDWIHKKYSKQRAKQLERLSTFTKESNIGANASPVDAIEEAFWEYDFQWEDIEMDTKIQNIVISVIRRDVNYIKVEELMERNPANWKSYLEQEWTKHAAPAYQMQMGYSRNWERGSFKSGHGRSRRPLNLEL